MSTELKNNLKTLRGRIILMLNTLNCGKELPQSPLETIADAMGWKLETAEPGKFLVTPDVPEGMVQLSLTDIVWGDKNGLVSRPNAPTSMKIWLEEEEVDDDDAIRSVLMEQIDSRYCPIAWKIVG